MRVQARRSMHSLVQRSSIGLLLSVMLLSGCAAGPGTEVHHVGVAGAGCPAQGAGASVPASTGAEANGTAWAAESLAESNQKIQSNIQYVSSIRGVTADEVIAMAHAKVDEALIIRQVRSQGMASPLTAHDIVRLQQSGVSSPVIAAMQQTPPSRRPPVVVADGRYWYPRRYYY